MVIRFTIVVDRLGCGADARLTLDAVRREITGQELAGIIDVKCVEPTRGGDDPLKQVKFRMDFIRSQARAVTAKTASAIRPTE
jgi:hypothetical protein